MKSSCSSSTSCEEAISDSRADMVFYYYTQRNLLRRPRGLTDEVARALIRDRLTPGVHSLVHVRRAHSVQHLEGGEGGSLGVAGALKLRRRRQVSPVSQRSPWERHRVRNSDRLQFDGVGSTVGFILSDPYRE